MKLLLFFNDLSMKVLKQRSDEDQLMLVAGTLPGAG